jgi:hypothetical protein
VVQFGDKLRDAKADELVRAEAVCDAALQQASATDARDVVVMLARVQMLRTGAVAGKGGPETAALFALEVLRHAAGPAPRAPLVEKAAAALAALQADTTPRMLVRPCAPARRPVSDSVWRR